MGAVSAVTFDVDGTLYDLRRVRVRAGLRMLRRLKFLRTFTQVRETMRRLGSFEDIRREQAQRVAAALGMPVDETARLIEECIYGKFFSIVARSRPFAGLKEALEEMVRAGLKIGIISDYPSETKLAGLGLSQLPWAAVVNSETLGKFKPQRGPFEEALRLLQLPAERVLHVGDREDVDVAGARAAGIRAALFAPRGPAPPSRADFVFGSYSELVVKVKELA